MTCRFKVSNAEVDHSTDMKLEESLVIQMLGSLQVELVLFQDMDIREVTLSNVSILRTTLDQQRVNPPEIGAPLQVVDAQRRGKESHVHSKVGPHLFRVCMRCSVVLGVARRALLFVFRWGSTRTATVSSLKHLMTVRVVWYIHGSPRRISTEVVPGVCCV